jgi:hypothetical protein
MRRNNVPGSRYRHALASHSNSPDRADTVFYPLAHRSEPRRRRRALRVAPARIDPSKPHPTVEQPCAES